MVRQTKRKNSERGVALIFALLAILVLSILAVAILGTSMAQNWTSYNYRLTAQARYAAGTREILESYFAGKPIRTEYLIVDKGKLAGAGAYAYSAGDATKGSEEATRYKKRV